MRADDRCGALRANSRPRAIIERSQGAVRKQEGLDDQIAVLAGRAVSETIAAENGIKLKIDFEHGQKTGEFLDQRENRAIVRGQLRRARACSTRTATRADSALAALAGGARKRRRDGYVGARARDGAARISS